MQSKPFLTLTLALLAVFPAALAKDRTTGLSLACKSLVMPGTPGDFIRIANFLRRIHRPATNEYVQFWLPRLDLLRGRVRVQATPEDARRVAIHVWGKAGSEYLREMRDPDYTIKQTAESILRWPALGATGEIPMFHVFPMSGVATEVLGGIVSRWLIETTLARYERPKDLGLPSSPEGLADAFHKLMPPAVLEAAAGGIPYPHDGNCRNSTLLFHGLMSVARDVWIDEFRKVLADHFEKVPVGGKIQYGDIVVVHWTDPEWGEAEFRHAAIYLDDHHVFNKPTFRPHDAYAITRFEDAVSDNLVKKFDTERIRIWDGNEPDWSTISLEFYHRVK